MVFGKPFKGSKNIKNSSNFVHKMSLEYLESHKILEKQ